MADEPAAPKRKKSEKRQRGMPKAIRFLPAEYAVAAAKAQAAGLSFSAYVRAAATGSPGPRSQRRLAADAAMLHRIEALHMKCGSNMNQIARGGNSGLPVDLPELRLALRQWAELHDLIREAMGKVPA